MRVGEREVAPALFFSLSPSAQPPASSHVTRPPPPRTCARLTGKPPLPHSSPLLPPASSSPPSSPPPPPAARPAAASRRARLTPLALARARPARSWRGTYRRPTLPSRAVVDVFFSCRGREREGEGEGEGEGVRGGGRWRCEAGAKKGERKEKKAILRSGRPHKRDGGFASVRSYGGKTPSNKRCQNGLMLDRHRGGGKRVGTGRAPLLSFFLGGGGGKGGRETGKKPPHPFHSPFSWAPHPPAGTP